MVLGGTAETSPVDVGSLAQSNKQTLTTSGVKMNSELKLSSQIRAVEFLPVKAASKIKAILPRQHSETVIHAFDTTWLDCFNALYVEVSGSPTNRLQMVRNAAAPLLTATCKHEHISPVSASLH